jgi:hypothetical protein
LLDVVVVSRDAAVSAALAAAGYNVASMNPRRQLDWPQSAAQAEIAVLDLEDFDWAVDWVRALRRAEIDTPLVIIVKNLKEQAGLLDCAGSGVVPLTLPLSRDAVHAAVARAAKLLPARPETSPAQVEAQTSPAQAEAEASPAPPEPETSTAPVTPVASGRAADPEAVSQVSGPVPETTTAHKVRIRSRAYGKAGTRRSSVPKREATPKTAEDPAMGLTGGTGTRQEPVTQPPAAAVQRTPRTQVARTDGRTSGESPGDPSRTTAPPAARPRGAPKATTREATSAPEKPTAQPRASQRPAENGQQGTSGGIEHLPEVLNDLGRSRSDVVMRPSVAMREQGERPWDRFFRRPDRGQPGSSQEHDATEATPAIDLVRKLSGLAARLESPSHVGARIAALALELLRADAAAVLVPDNGDWSVAAGVNLRRVQTRLRLRPDHWLIREVLRGKNGLVVADTDAARARLAGVPLSQWKHLLALSVSDADSLVIVTRGEQPFDADDLSRLSCALVGDAPLLAQTLEIRDLARALARFTDRE